MDRREFLAAAGSVIGASALAKNTNTNSRTVGKPTNGEGRGQRIIVVGAGAMGGWTALWLAESGAEVVLLDAYGPGSSRAASSGETRLTRADYTNPLYARMAIESYRELKSREANWGEELIVPTGQLLLAFEDRTLEIDGLQKTLLSQNIKGVERLSPSEMKTRWPQIKYQNISTGLYTPGGEGASTLFARRITQRVAKAFEDAGGTILQAKALPPKRVGSTVEVSLSNGKTLNADSVIYACGAWMSNLFPEIIAPMVSVERRDVFYFGTPAGDTRFSFPELPAWAFVEGGFYGFPDLDGRGLKVAPYPDRNPIDPDTDDRRTNPYMAERAQSFLKERFPDLANQPILETRVCQVAYTNSQDFIIDKHPHIEGVWLMAGDSGHAFKHGPIIGRETASRVLGLDHYVPYAEAFKIKRKS